MESGWNVWVWLVGVVVRRYIDFLVLLIPTPLYLFFFAAASLLFVHLKKMFFVLYIYKVVYTVCACITRENIHYNINFVC